MVLTDSFDLRPKVLKAAFADPCDCKRIAAGGGLEKGKVAATCGFGFGVELKNAEVLALTLTLALTLALSIPCELAAV